MTNRPPVASCFTSLHLLGAALLGVIAWVHFKDIPDKLKETDYLGWAYILLVAGCAAAGAWLLSSHPRRGYVLGSVISLGATIGYVLTRTTGLPHATDDIGNWVELSGIVALVAEGAFLILSAVALRPARTPETVQVSPPFPNDH
ncbi:hypothetical protein [Deinococcus sp.]|uniref:hypothetical protein n=1 Tax=Deinococcus sp. TaxID=47478 RepID=UPI0025C261D5|nr:hypothetical protein [Deinococcus sp.]